MSANLTFTFLLLFSYLSAPLVSSLASLSHSEDTQVLL